MKLVPNILLSTSSNAERRLFETLEGVDLGDEWVAYHSLNCSEHQYKHWAEIDFLLLGPAGLLVLEVKGGRISCEEGVWTYTDRFGRNHRSSEGPFQQARSAMYALRTLIREKYRLQEVEIGRALFGFGVVFPDVDWSLDTPEMPGEIAADRLTATTRRGFTRFIRGLQDYWKAKSPNADPISNKGLAELQKCLRPDVDVYPPFTAQVGRAMRQMQRLTDEQYERLEVIEQNERVVISGGAGTGKTFLMLQCARRERSEGRHVLIVVDNPVLAAHLRTLESDRAIRILALEALPADPEPADVLMVDEGQDLLDLDVLAEISRHVQGGLDDGRWRWFMDENNQSGVSRPFNRDGLRMLLTGLTTGAPTRVPLLRNCRNTREIARQVHGWTGADIGRTTVSGHGSEPKLIRVDGQADTLEKLGRTVEELLARDLPAEEIGIVLPKGGDPQLLERLARNVRRRLMPIDVNTVRANLSNRIVWGTVDKFKGLERPIVLAVGFDGAEFALDRLAELYVASTRGNYGLYLFVGEPLAARLEENCRQYLAGFASEGVVT